MIDALAILTGGIVVSPQGAEGESYDITIEDVVS